MWERLTRLSAAALPTERSAAVCEECGVEGGEVPSYEQHRAALRREMSKARWPRQRADFDLLEKEIAKAQSYLRQSSALRKRAKRAEGGGRESTPTKEDEARQEGGQSEEEGAGEREGEEEEEEGEEEEKEEGEEGGTGSSASSVAVLVSELSLRSGAEEGEGERGRRQRRRGGVAAKLKGSRVIARSNIDGYYYPGEQSVDIEK